MRQNGYLLFECNAMVLNRRYVSMIIFKHFAYSKTIERLYAREFLPNSSKVYFKYMKCSEKIRFLVYFFGFVNRMIVNYRDSRWWCWLLLLLSSSSLSLSSSSSTPTFYLRSRKVALQRWKKRERITENDASMAFVRLSKKRCYLKMVLGVHQQ